MFLPWLNLKVHSVSELLWYLETSPPLPKLNDPHIQSSPYESITSQGADSDISAKLPPHPEVIPIECSTSSLFALIIGINKYADDNIRNLRGAVADADEVNKFLVSLKVSQDRIINLRDKEASRDAILRSIRGLAENPKIKKDDPILIFYAGHGAQAKAPSGWPTVNANGMVQMLVPHDFVFTDAKRGQGILDVTLFKLLVDLATKKSDNITVIFDSCYSGSGTRKEDPNDESFSVRGIELPAGYMSPVDNSRDDIYAPRADFITQRFQTAGLRSHVLLAACKQDQEAKERQGRGAFTSELLRLLQEQGVDKLTYRDVITRLHDLPEQNPQCEGVHQNRILFNSRVADPCHELYRICGTRTPGQYDLKAGEAHGITKGAEFIVYSDREMSSFIGTVIASHTTAFNTRCIVAGTSFVLSQPAFALQTRVGEGHDVRILIELNDNLLDVFVQMGKEMRSTHLGKRSFRLVDAKAEKPDLVLTYHNGHIEFDIMNDTCQRYGVTRMPFEVDIDPGYICSIVRSAANFYWNLYHSNKEGKIISSRKITLECFKLVESDELTDDFEEVLVPDPAGQNLNVGGVITIDVDESSIYGYKITNDFNFPLYAALFYYDISDMSIVSYYMPGTAAGGKADFSIPAHEALTVGFGAGGASPRRYYLRPGQIVDIGFLKLYLSTEYVDYSGIAQASPFDKRRADRIPDQRKKHLWDTLTVQIVQKEV